MVSVALAQEPRDTVAKPTDSSEYGRTFHDRAFTAWSSPEYKGHKQPYNGTRG